MKRIIAALLGLALIAVQGCVGAKVYRKEKTTRIAAEAREKMLVQEVLQRRNESNGFVKMVAELNRSLGQQDTEIKDLQAELTDRTQSMGESASKLLSEKGALDKRLAETREELEKRNDVINKVKGIQFKRKNVLIELEIDLSKAFQAQKIAGVTIGTDAETVKMSIPDNLLFEANGVAISPAGRNLLAQLAGFLSSKPSINLEIVAYTDNKLPPKDKTLIDTWDWSLQRATNVARILVREYNANANQLTPVGKGEFYPVTSNETAEGRLKNRRTEIVFKPLMPAVPLAE